MHICISDRLRATLEWSPAAWWQEPWRVFTYGLVHANVPHLTLNAFVALAVSIYCPYDDAMSIFII